tara:strand:+ start:1938 stop:2609 length:672 start_codon:yes stop_codon:yes gene_type:complete
MESDVTSPVSTCASDVSFSVSTSDSCIICFCSDEETESHDCDVCRQGAWKVCVECKEKLKRLKKCPVCASENINYISESESDDTHSEEEIRDGVAIIRRNRRTKKICTMFIACVAFSFLGVFSVLSLSDFYGNSQCFIIYVLAILNSGMSLLVVLTHLAGEEVGECYTRYVWPILTSFILFLTTLLNGYCHVFFTNRNIVPLIIFIFITVICLMHMIVKYCDL